MRRSAAQPLAGRRLRRADRAPRGLHRVRPAVDGPLPAGVPGARRRPRREPGGGPADPDRGRHRAGRRPAGARAAVRRLGAPPAAARLDPGLRACVGAVRARAVGGLLTVWRFLQGASGGGGIVLARAVAADIASGVAAARLFSLFMTLSSVAPIVAPVLGGVLLAWTGSWRPMFYLLARSACCSPRPPGWPSRRRCRRRAGTAAACGRPGGPSPTWPATGCSPGTR